MFERSMLRVLGALLLVLSTLIGMALAWPVQPLRIALSLVMILPLYLFPFLQDTRSCWLWCGPSPIGWIGVAAFWISAIWFIAWCITETIRVYAKKGEPKRIDSPGE